MNRFSVFVPADDVSIIIPAPFVYIQDETFEECHFAVIPAKAGIQSS